MRPLVYIMTPVLLLTIILAARFVTWDGIKGAVPEAQAHLQEGTAALRDWKVSQAIAAFTRAIEVEPNYAEAYVKRGLAFYRSGQYEAALADYNRTLNLNRYQADAYASRGDVYRALGDREQAIADYSASLENRWNASVVRKRASVYFGKGASEKALADYNTVVARQPTALAYYARGNVYLRISMTGDDTHLKSALADMNEAVILEPRFASAYISRGQIYEDLGEAELATADYQKAVELFTEILRTWQGESYALTQVYIWRAFAYQKLGEVGAAEADINKLYENVFSFFLEKNKKL